MIDNVVHIVEKELKQILKRDINKRICETYAFLLYDNWWSEQDVRHKEKMEISWTWWMEVDYKCMIAQFRFYLVCLTRIS